MHRIVLKSSRLVKLLFLVTAFNTALSQSPNSENEFGFAQKLYEDKLFKLAGEQFRAFAKKYPAHEKSDDALFMSGNAYFDDSDFAQAFDSYKNLEISYPQSEWLAAGRFRMAQAIAQQRKFADAAELFKRVPIFHPESEWAARAYLEAGRSYMKSGATKLARDSFLTLIQSYPDAPERFSAHLDLVNSYLQQNEYKEALSHIDGIFRAFGAEFKEPRVYLLRAAIFQKLGQVEEAESLYLKLLKEFPNDNLAQEANFHLGDLYASRKMGNQALSYLDKFVANSSDKELLTQAYIKRAEILYSEHKYDEALKSYNEALLKSQGSATVVIRLNIARTLRQLGRSRDAVEILQTIRSSADSSVVADVYSELVAKLIELRSYQNAIMTINEFKLKFPGHSEIADFYLKNAVVYENDLHDYSKALRAYDQFLERFPFHPDVDEAQLGLARSYERLGDYPLAAREWSNYLSRYPGGDNYTTAKARFDRINETIPLETTHSLLIANLLKKAPQNNDDIEWHIELGKTLLDAKEFVHAAEQFRHVLQVAADLETKRSAYHLLGQAYFKAAEKSLLRGQQNTAESYLDSASISLRFLTNNQDSTQQSDDAFLLLSRIEATRAELLQSPCAKCVEIYREYEKRFPGGRHTDYISMRLANDLLATAADNDLTVLEEALQRYLKIQEASEFYEEAKFKEAFVFTKLGVDTLAVKKWKDFIERFPNGPYSAEALLMKARLERRHQNFDSAIDNLKRLLSDFYYSPLAGVAQKELGDIYFQTGDFQSALDGYRDVNRFRSSINGVNGSVETSDLGYKAAQANDQLGNWEAALSQYLDFVAHNPGHKNVPKALLAVARICQKQNNWALAREYYQKLLQYAPENSIQFQCYKELGDIFFNQDLYDDALAHYLAAVKIAANPTEEEYPAQQVVRCRYKLKQFPVGDSEAEAFKKKFKDAKDADAQFLLDKGNAYISDKNFEQAEKAFKKLRSDFKNTEYGADGEFGLGKVYLITNHTEDALKILTDIPSKYPESPVTPLTYFNLGDFYYKSQQVENAIGAFKNVLAHPKAGKYHQLALRYLIKCYSDIMWWDLAIVSVREYLNTYPYAEDAFNMKIELARLLMNLREYPRAIASFLELQPFASPETEAEIQFYIAQCYREMGNFTRAVAEYLRVKYLTAPTKLPWHVTALFEASKCLLSLGETEQAKTILKKIISSEGLASNFGRFAAQKLEELENEQSANR